MKHYKHSFFKLRKITHVTLSEYHFEELPYFSLFTNHQDTVLAASVAAKILRRCLPSLHESVKVLRRCKDAADWKIAEALAIRDRNPT